MQVLKGKYSGLWSARDILYYYCPLCAMHIPWRKYARSSVLVGDCCGYVYNARPLNEASRFELFVCEADLSNVIVLSIIDCGPVA